MGNIEQFISSFNNFIFQQCEYKETVKLCECKICLNVKRLLCSLCPKISMVKDKSYSKMYSFARRIYDIGKTMYLHRRWNSGFDIYTKYITFWERKCSKYITDIF